MNDIKRPSNAHVWCKSISILEAQYDCPDEWNMKQVLLLSRLNEYYGGTTDSILGSHESFVPNNSLRGMYSISSGSTNIIRWKGKWAKILSCHNKRQMITPLSITWEGLWLSLNWLILTVNMHVGCKIYLWQLHTGLRLWV